MDIEIANNLISYLMDNLVLPAATIVVTGILVKLNGYFKTFTESTKDKNEKEGLAAVSTVMTQVMEQVELCVSAAVAANMKLANSYKSDASGKLTESEINHLIQTAVDLTYAMLPTNITQGSLLTLLGGKTILDVLIRNMIDKALIEIKSMGGAVTGTAENPHAPLESAVPPSNI